MIKSKTLVERILEHHHVDKPRDGHGGRLSVVQIVEFAEGVACVQDSLGEYDLFFDTNQWELTEVAGGIYRSFLETAKQGVALYEKMRKKYGMVCIVEDRWNPWFARRRNSFISAYEAAQALLKPKDASSSWYLFEVHYPHLN